MLKFFPTCTYVYMHALNVQRNSLISLASGKGLVLSLQCIPPTEIMEGGRDREYSSEKCVLVSIRLERLSSSDRGGMSGRFSAGRTIASSFGK